jgi:hypothetical protein
MAFPGKITDRQKFSIPYLSDGRLRPDQKLAKWRRL